MNLQTGLAWTLIHFLWQGALIVALLGLALKLMPRSRADLRYQSACASLLLMVAAVSMTLVWEVRKPSLSSDAVASESLAGSVEPADQDTPSSQVPPSSPRYVPFVLNLWLAGVVALSVRSVLSYRAAQQFRKRNSKAAPPVWQQRLATIARRLEIRRAVRLCESVLVDAPAVVGWLRPVVIVPASALAGLEPIAVDALLAHELAHVRRHDYLVNLLQTVVENLLFYHPAVWWVGRIIRAERENCCDDLAVQVSGDVVTYVRALAGMEALRHSAPQMAMAANRGSLLGRVRRLAKAHENRRTISPDWITVPALLLCVATIWAAAKLPAARVRQGPVPAVPIAWQRVVMKPSPYPSPAPNPPEAPEAPEAPQAPELSAPPDPPDPPEPPQAPEPPRAGTGFVEAMDSLGYRNLGVDDLIRLKNHGVTAEYVQQLRAGGYNPSVDDLIKMQTHGVTPEYARRLKALGFRDLSIDRLVALQIHGVSPEFVERMKAAGYNDLTLDQVQSMQIHGVSPEYVRQMREAGFDRLSVEKLTELQIHGVSPDYVRRMREAGVEINQVDQLKALQIHGVSPDFVAQMRSLGLGEVNVERLTALKIHGVTPEYAREMQSSGLRNLNTDNLTKLRIHGVEPEFVKRAVKHGFKDLSVDQLIRLRQVLSPSDLN